MQQDVFVDCYLCHDWAPIYPLVVVQLVLEIILVQSPKLKLETAKMKDVIYICEQSRAYCTPLSCS